jgi:hypothetical protein
MASLLARVKESEAAASAAATSNTTSTAGTASTTAGTATDTSNAATGATAPTLSDQLVAMLVMMQMQSSDGQTSPSQTSTGQPATDPAANNPSASATGACATGPISQAFSALDTNGDGTISQSELESAVKNAGGTAAEADGVYSALGGTANAGISESSFAAAAQAGAPPEGGPAGAGGHHHHHHHAGSASDGTSQLLSALDPSQGSASTDAWSAATSGTIGSTSSGATGSNGSGSLSQDELTTASPPPVTQSGQTVQSAFLQLANQSYAASLGIFASTSSAQLATA